MMKPKVFRWVCIPLLLFAWFNPLVDGTLATLGQDAANALESLALLESLYLLAESGASVKLPLVSGTFEGAAETLQQAIQYLSVANIAIAVNLLLAKLAHAKGLLVLLVLAWVASFWKRHQTLFYKVLMIGFLLNPGLDIYTYFINSLDAEVQLDAQDRLHQEITLVHNDYVQKEEMRKKELQARKEKQLAKDKEKGKDHLTLVQKVEDTVTGVAESGVVHLAEDYRLTKKAIKFAASKALELVLNAFTSILFMYILLPLGYLYVAYKFIEYLFEGGSVLEKAS
ncbi:hypothetical protein AB9P05_17870 [Roseivirga sp. BDSF3-8]|uniref:hypothetical protein n=1 Tax=Roseivirga sp. BDSF3-8 TaxID=3241598 RepID=UPI003532771F